MSVTIIGSFTYNSDTNTLVGPAEYMQERGNERVRSIQAGTDIVFNYGITLPGSDVMSLVLVSLQSDFGAWLGRRDLLGRLSAGQAAADAGAQGA
jgi:hypothetical protein